MKQNSAWKRILGMAVLLSVFAGSSQAEVLSMESLPKVKSVALHQGKPPQIHAATDKGLYVSHDEGRSWSSSYQFKLPATLVSATADGSIYAFVVGKGLLRIRGDEVLWTPVNNNFGAQVLTQISSSPEQPHTLLGLNQFGGILLSADDGKTWSKKRGRAVALNEAQARGKKRFAEDCQSCHGTEGVGETYTLQALTDKNYILAPALDDSAHAWHHSDEALVQTILNGSPRSERMIAWKTKGTTEQEAQDLVAYIKTLWGKKALACQGPKHMNCKQ